MTAHLRERLGSGPLVIPGVGTPLEARCAIAAGFDSLYLSGYAVAAWRHGQPDVGLIALDDVSEALAAVTEATPVPVMVDADTGYGDVANVRRAVRRLERLGAHAIQLEDQAWPKRCGHLAGKTVIPAAEHARKIAAAVAAREDERTLIVARTDALAPLGLDEALDRCKRYADVGADILFVDAPTSIDELQAIASALSGATLMANMSESGVTPQLDAAEFHELGFPIVMFPTSALRIAAHTITSFYADLRKTGGSRGWTDRMVTLDELNALVGLGELEKFEAGVIDAAR